MSKKGNQLLSKRESGYAYGYTMVLLHHAIVLISRTVADLELPKGETGVMCATISDNCSGDLP